MRGQFFFLWFCCILSYSSAQYKYDQQWLISNFNLLDFRNSTIQISNKKSSNLIYNTGTYTSSTCDENGELLMISSGCRILNNEMKLMLNGDSINMDLANDWCKFLDNDFPIRQSQLVVPDLTNLDNFYALNYNLENFSGNKIKIPVPSKLLLSTVNKTLDNGKGAVVNKRLVVISDTLHRGYLTSCMNNNANAWWLLIPEYGTNCFYKVKLDESSYKIEAKECLGLTKNDSIGVSGFASFSPDSKWYAYVSGQYTMVLYNFNNVNGELSNFKQITFESDSTSYKSICFSPDSRYLYLIMRLKIYQFDLNSLNIEKSGIIAGSIDLSKIIDEQSSLGNAKLGPDGKIYIFGNGNHRYLSVIERPNCRGLDCGFNQHKIELILSSYGGMQNTPHYSFSSPSYTCDTLLSEFSKNVESTIKIFNQGNKILIKTNINENLLLNISNMNGLNIASAQFNINGTYEYTHNLQSGVYFVELIQLSNNKKERYKFFIL